MKKEGIALGVALSALLNRLCFCLFLSSCEACSPRLHMKLCQASPAELPIQISDSSSIFQVVLISLIWLWHISNKTLPIMTGNLALVSIRHEDLQGQSRCECLLYTTLGHPDSLAQPHPGFYLRNLLRKKKITSFKPRQAD
jgi:hypothetical protein